MDRTKSQALAREGLRWQRSTVNGDVRLDIALGSEAAPGTLPDDVSSPAGMLDCDGYTSMLVTVLIGDGANHQYDIEFRAALATETQPANPNTVEEMPEKTERVIDLAGSAETAKVAQYDQLYDITGYRYIGPYITNFTGDGGSTLHLIVTFAP